MIRHWEQRIERARYEADRAARQFQACEPENRLVARTLEAAWGDRLAAVTRAEAALATEQARQPSPLSAEETGWLTRAGADIRAIFEAPTTTSRERKQLIRALLSEVTLTVDRQARTAALTLSWEGGAITQRTVALPRLGAPWRTTQASTVDLIRRLAAHYDDATIAGVLARQHRRTGTGLTFTKARVAEVRRNYRIPPFSQTAAPACHDGHVVSITRAAAELGVGSPPSTGGSPTGSSPVSSSPPARPGGSGSTTRCGPRSPSTRPRAGYHCGKPPPPSASPGRPFCIRSNAANSPPCTSAVDDAAACVSR